MKHTLTSLCRYGGVATLLLVGAPEASRACGGFFCSNFPVNQVNERILFVQDEGTITTHVQIQYNGNAPDFAWILPVPSIPELTVSHNDLFTQLQFATQPSFFLDFKEDQGCGLFFPPFARVLDSAAEAEDGGVQVVSSGRVGPYETAVITADDPDALVQWLEDNNYDLDAVGSELLRPYVDGGFYFLALRLAPDRDLGDLQPIALTYQADQPAIPIRLTAVATQPDMGVLVWVLGEQRAIPQNYLHVQINEARIDWFNGGFNYNEVVTEAANEADGQAFVTDFAGASKIMEQRIFLEGRFSLEGLPSITDPARFIDELLIRGFPRDAQMQSLLRRHIPMPTPVLTEGVLQVVFRGDEDAYLRSVNDGTLQTIAESSFYNNINAYEEYTGRLEFDPVPLIADIEAVIVEPLRDAQKLFDDHPYLTRLFTTLSAEEMTVDPVFAFNPDLPDVTNTHSAEAHFECRDGEETLPEDLVLVITLKDGRQIRSNPFEGFDPNPEPRPFEPAAAVIEQLDTSGPPTTLVRATGIGGEVTTNGEEPNQFALGKNFPNPFNSGTVLPFSVPATSDEAPISLKIYNLLGQSIRTVWTGTARPGTYRLDWDGRDALGNKVSSGVYLYRLESGNIEMTRKLLLLR